MSIEAALAELTAAVVANTEALNGNTSILEKLEAGRAAAVSALESKTEKPATRTRKAKDEPTAGNASAGTASPVADAKTASEPVGPSDDDLRKAATDYIKGAGEDVEERNARGTNFKALLAHFGVAMLVGDTGINDADDRAKALFFLKRYAAGKPVDFSADYDFSGDPAQGDDADDFDAIG